MTESGDRQQAPNEVPDQGASSARKPWWRSKPFLWCAGTLGAIIAAAAAAFGTGLGDRLFKSIDSYDVQVLADRDAIISLNAQISNIGGEYIFDQPIQQIGRPPSDANTCDGRHQWARQHAGIDVEATVGRVSISAAEGNQVTIVGVKPAMVGERQFPAVGSIATCPGRGGGPKILDINLDTGAARFFENINDPEGQPFTSIPVPAGSTYDFDFVATTQQYQWSYRIQVTLNVNGEIVTRDLDDAGKPFQTTARTNGRAYQWLNGEWQDVTVSGDAGEAPPSGPPNPPDSQNPCKIVSDTDVASELGSPVQVELFGGPSPGASGFPIIGYICLHNAKSGDVVQVDYVEVDSPEHARAEFEKQVARRDGKRNARDAPGYGGPAKLINNESLVILLDNKILTISRTPPQGVSAEDNTALLARLAMIGASRLS